MKGSRYHANDGRTNLTAVGGEAVLGVAVHAVASDTTLY